MSAFESRSIAKTASTGPDSSGSGRTFTNRLGVSIPNSTDQVVTQGGVQSRARRRIGNIRGLNPIVRSSLFSGPDGSVGRNITPLRLESFYRPRVAGRINPHINRSKTNEHDSVAIVVPHAKLSKIEPKSIRKRTSLVSLNPSNETNPERAEIPKTELEQFKSEGFNTRTESKGDRFVFIIDKSESMLDDDRMNGAKQALSQTLDKLGAEKSYFIYFFSDKAFKMEPDRMLESTAHNKSETMKWVKGVSAEGFTNPRDALKDAFERLEPSTIWLLSDGKFTSYKSRRSSKKSWRQPRIASVLKVIRELNSAKVRINTIGFAAREGKVDDSLREIARENGGTYRFIPTGDK